MEYLLLLYSLSFFLKVFLKLSLLNCSLKMAFLIQKKTKCPRSKKKFLNRKFLKAGKKLKKFWILCFHLKDFMKWMRFAKLFRNKILTFEMNLMYKQKKFRCIKIEFKNYKTVIRYYNKILLISKRSLMISKKKGKKIHKNKMNCIRNWIDIRIIE